jgi:hypothetical protein
MNATKLQSTESNAELMTALCDSITTIVEPYNNVCGFVIMLVRDDGNFLVQSKASIEQLADILHSAHGALAETVDEAFKGQHLQ